MAYQLVTHHHSQRRSDHHQSLASREAACRLSLGGRARSWPARAVRFDPPIGLHGIVGLSVQVMVAWRRPGAGRLARIRLAGARMA
jgi:hypothetical protein